MNNTQLALMQAFHDCGVEDVVGLSFPGNSAWGSAFRWKHGENYSLADGVQIREMPFLSLGPLQPISQLVTHTWILLTTPRDQRPDVILITNPLVRLSAPALLAGKVWRRPVVIIASDFTPTRQSTSTMRYLRQWLQQKMIEIAPGVVVFSNHIGRELRAKRPWIRMVRPSMPDLLDIPPKQPDADPHIVYFAGTTAEVSGVKLLLEAIALIKDARYQFWFSGRGPLDEAIHQAAATDSRIEHWGFVSRQQYQDLLRQASVLVNPRPTALPENRYNFPSKLMEYMAAGRPIISTATSDVGEYYQDAIVLLEDETPQGLATKITETCELPFPVQLRLGQLSRQYVESESWEAQAQHILDFCASLQR